LSNLESGLAYRLQTLVCKGEAAQTQSLDDIPWSSIEPARPFWMSRSSIAWGISQFYHGEMATAALCRVIAEIIDCPVARSFLATQIRDEERHARIYAKYLHCMGFGCADNDILKDLHHAVSARAHEPIAMILATHVVLEGESLALQQTLRPWMPCPLFAEISRVIARDEARHHAFGRLFLQGTLPHRPLAERLAHARWIKNFWEAGIRKTAQKLKPPGFQILYGGWNRWLTGEWQERLDRLMAAGLFREAERPLFVDP